MPIISDHAVDAGEKIAKVLPIGIFTAFQYIAAQITVAFCDPIEKAFFITFVAVFTVLSAILAVTMRYRGDTSLKPLPKGELKKRVVAHLQKLTEETIRAEKAANCKNLTKEKKAAAKRKPKKQIEEETQEEAAARLQKLTGEDKAAAKKKARKQIRKEHKKWERKKQHLLYWARALGCATIFLSLALLTSPAPTCLFRKGDTNDSYIPRYASACICTTFLFILSAFAQLDGVVTPPAPDTSDKKMHAGGTDEESQLPLQSLKPENKTAELS